jgi:L-cysteate sulfo-lyase
MFPARTNWVQQADEMELRIACIVTATGSAVAHAGLVVGLEGMNARRPVPGIGVQLRKDTQEANVYRLACATADSACEPAIPREAILANCDHVGEGYGMPTAGMGRAVRRCRRRNYRPCWIPSTRARRCPG